MMSIESGFRNALAKFSSGLSPKEVEEFRFTTLDDVHKVVVTIQHQQARRKEMMNLTRIQSFVEAMKNFGEVIEVFLNLSEFVPFIWGPIKFLLQVSALLLSPIWILSHGLVWLSIPPRHQQMSKCFHDYPALEWPSAFMIHSNMKAHTGSEVGKAVSRV